MVDHCLGIVHLSASLFSMVDVNTSWLSMAHYVGTTIKYGRLWLTMVDDV